MTPYAAGLRFSVGVGAPTTRVSVRSVGTSFARPSVGHGRRSADDQWSSLRGIAAHAA